jgi:hypothetical protein
MQLCGSHARFADAGAGAANDVVLAGSGVSPIVIITNTTTLNTSFIIKSPFLNLGLDGFLKLHSDNK